MDLKLVLIQENISSQSTPDHTTEIRQLTMQLIETWFLKETVLLQSLYNRLQSSML